MRKGIHRGVAIVQRPSTGADGIRFHAWLKLALLLVVGTTTQAFATNTGPPRPVSGEQLEQVLAAARGEQDSAVARKLFEMELTERLSAARLSRCASIAGPLTRQALVALADTSAFLAPSAVEIAALAKPDIAAQRKMISLTIDYVTKTIHQLPNFYATRLTTSFQDNPPYADSVIDGARGSVGTLVSGQPLHPVGRYTATVLYRKGQEIVQAVSGHNGPQGLTTSGEFGPILGTALLDAAHGNLVWSHWEQGDGPPRAVFRFSVPKEKSHYDVSYCCVQRGQGNPVPFHQFSAYDGEITIDPSNGTILRLSLKATNLKRPDPIIKANILVEFGPVQLGDRTYICPLKGIALSVSLERQPMSGSATDNDPLQTSLNDVAFNQYHLYHGSARLLSGDPQNSADAQPASVPEKSASSEASVANPENPASPETSGPAQNPTIAVPAESATALPAASSPVPEITVTTATALPDTPPVSDAAFSLRSTARLVDVGVMAYDKKGHPVTGLNRENFAIYDNGRKQIAGFFTRAADAPGEAASATPSSPQSAYSNRRPAATGDGNETSTTVLLIDASNLAWSDLINARKQMLRCLQALPSGERVALFILQANGFQVLQEGTTDHALLATQLTQWAPSARDVARAQEEETRNRQQIDTVQNEADLQSVNGNTSSSPDAAATSDPQLRAEGRNPGRDALSMLTNVARKLAAVSGHKSLVWVTSDNVLADWTDQAVSSDKGSKHIDKWVLHAQEALNDAQVSLYPLDASQLETMAVDPSLANRNVELSPGTVIGPQPQGGGAQNGRIAAEMQQDLHPIQAPIRQLAAATGGRAIRRTGDLAAALGGIVEEGRAAYLLSFTPDQPADDKFHLLTVTLTGPPGGKEIKGVKLRYRAGYFYAKEPVSLKDRVRQAISQPLDVSEIALSASPVATPRGATLKLNIATSDLALKEYDQRWTGKLDIFLVQREDGSAHSRVSGQVIGLNLMAATYRKAAASGVPLDQEVEKEQRTGSIRVVVVDENSGRIGSITVPAIAFQGKWH